MKLKLSLISVLILLIFAILFGKKSTEKGSLLIKNSHYGSVEALTLFPDSKFFASTAYDYKMKVWDLNQKKHVKTLDTGVHLIRDIFVSNKYPLLYGVGNEGTIHIWDLQTIEPVNVSDPLYFPVGSMQLSEDERYLVGVTEKSLALFEIHQGVSISFISFLGEEQHDNVVGAFFRGDRLISVGGEGKIIFWDYRKGTATGMLETGKPIYSADISKNGKMILAGYTRENGSDHSELEFWDLEGEISMQHFGQCKGAVLDILFSDFDEFAVISCSESPLLKISPQGENEPENIWDELKPGVRNLNYSSAMNALLYTTGTNIGIVWNFE